MHQLNKVALQNKRSLSRPSLAIQESNRSLDSLDSSKLAPMGVK